MVDAAMQIITELYSVHTLTLLGWRGKRAVKT